MDLEGSDDDGDSEGHLDCEPLGALRLGVFATFGDGAPLQLRCLSAMHAIQQCNQCLRVTAMPSSKELLRHTYS
jgi:hypothetical protein